MLDQDTKPLVIRGIDLALSKAAGAAGADGSLRFRLILGESPASALIAPEHYRMLSAEGVMNPETPIHFLEIIRATLRKNDATLCPQADVRIRFSKRSPLHGKPPAQVLTHLEAQIRRLISKEAAPATLASQAAPISETADTQA